MIGFIEYILKLGIYFLHKQLAGSELEQLNVPIGTGLDDILETIRIHWERDVEKNRLQAGALLQAKVRGKTSTLTLPCAEGGQAKMNSSQHVKEEKQPFQSH